MAVGLGGMSGCVGRKEHSFDEELGKDITNAPNPGRAAVIAEVLEESEPSVNNGMASFGGVVFQRSIYQTSTLGESAKAADVDELRAKIEDAIENRRLKLRRAKSCENAGFILFKEQAAEGRRKRPERLVAEIKRRPT